MSVAKKILMGSGAEDYEIDQSLMFSDSDGSYLHKTPSGAGNQKTWTWSAWVKRASTGSDNFLWSTYTAQTDAGYMDIVINSSNVLMVGGWNTAWRTSNRKFRDLSAWYHIMVVLDTTQSTANDRIKVYVNGVQETSFSATNNPDEDDDMPFNRAEKNIIGGDAYQVSAGGTTREWDGYLAEVHFIDGTALAASAFGETDSDTGQWVPKEYNTASGAYGTNGFYLKFVSGALGTDSAGSNNYTAVNLADADVMTDTPTNNYCTINPLDNYTTSLHPSSLSQGNLRLESDSTSDTNKNHPTIVPLSGKWYYEVKLIQLNLNGSTGYIQIQGSASSYIWSYYNTPTTQILGNGSTYSISNWSVNDVIQVAIDYDDRKVWYGLNNTWYNTGGTANPATGADAADDFAASSIGVPTNMRIELRSGSGTNIVEVNYGQKGFAYTPPTGFKALNAANLPTPTIAKPTDHFNALLYTGNDTDDRALTGVGFQPDLVWIKCRSINANHGVSDSQRVDSGTYKIIYPDANNAESTSGTYISAISSDGFSLANSGSDNQNNETYVAWSWKANGSGSTNDDGATDSTVSVNTTAGFSIVTFTMPSSGSTTFGHGLGAVPDYIIAKGTGASGNWSVWVKPPMDSTDDYMQLNTNAAQGSYSTVWGAAVPTSSVFGATCGGLVQADTTGVAYCFAEVEGYSKCGSFTGNGNVDGPFIYTGFRPAFTMIKRTDSTANWFMYDNKRDPSNIVDEGLFADIVNSETTQTNGMIDYVSNGFKIRNTGTAMNASSGTFSYMAFAEFPFKYSNAR